MEKAPNIILILADDLGYGDCTVTNPESKIKTPHIKQLAKEGLSFSDAHSAASTCTPSRYGLLTGINPVRTGVLNTLLSEGKPIISEEEKTIAHLLKDQGYTTHMIGKWHLGFDMGGKKKVFDFDKPFTGGPWTVVLTATSASIPHPERFLSFISRIARPWQNPRKKPLGRK